MVNIFLVSHVLLLFHSPEYLWNKLKNMSNSENIFHIALGTVQWQLRIVFTLLLNENWLRSIHQMTKSNDDQAKLNEYARNKKNVIYLASHMSSVTDMGHFYIAKTKETSKYFYLLMLPLKKKQYFIYLFLYWTILTLFYASLHHSVCPLSHIWGMLI